jgi:phosphinothricin acetyltransferase
VRTRPELAVRAATREDAAAINAIYNHYVATSHATFDLEPMGLDARLGWLAHRAGGRHRAIVAVEEGAVLGYAASARHIARAAYDPTVQTSVYVDERHLGRGIGTRLYAALFELLDGEDVHRACAGISLPNPGSIALHERFGFREVGRFTEQGRKFGRYWDVAWYERPMSRPA